MADHTIFGQEAEELAVQYLQNHGYTILARNYRAKKAEIDIIVETPEALVFIEVKARATDVFIAPEKAVNKKKIQLIVFAANQFLEQISIAKEARFDIITLLKDKSNNVKIQHIKDAFEAFDAN